MDYGTYLKTKKALLAKLKAAGGNYERTGSQHYLNSLRKYRAEVDTLDRENPTCAKMFLESQQRRAEAVR